MILFGKIGLEKSFEPTRVSISDDSAMLFDRTLERRGRFYRFKKKASITVDFDYLTFADAAEMQKLLSNGTIGEYSLVDIPGSSNLITLPSLTGQATQAYWGQLATWDITPAALIAAGTEFSAGQYTNAQVVDANYTMITGASAKYTWMLFKFDVSAWPPSDTHAVPRRWGMNWVGMAFTGGATVHNIDYVYNFNQARWETIHDSLEEAVTVDINTFLYYQLFKRKPVDRAYNLFSDYISSNKVYFLHRARELNSLVLVNYVAMVLNSYGVAPMDGSDAFNFREAFTGAGYRGTLDLKEV